MDFNNARAINHTKPLPLWNEVCYRIGKKSAECTCDFTCKEMLHAMCHEPFRLHSYYYTCCMLQICVMKHKVLGCLHSETCRMECVIQNVFQCKHPLNYHNILTLYDKYISMAAVLWYHPVLVPLNILHIPLCLLLKHPLKNRTRK